MAVASDYDQQSGSDAEDASTDGGIESVHSWDTENELDPKKGMAWWQVSLSIIVIVIGAGVMALPSLPKKGGWISCAVFLVAGGLAVSQGSKALWKGFMAYQHGTGGKRLTSFEDFGRTSFGTAGEVLVLVTMGFYFEGVVTGYMVLVTDSLAHLSSDAFSPRQWMLVVAPVMALIVQLPNMTALSHFAPVGVVAAMGVCLIIMAKSLMDAGRWHDWPEVGNTVVLHEKYPHSFLSVGVVVATLFGAFGVNGNVPSLLVEMREPKDFPLAMNIGLSTVACLYLGVMFCSYYAYGEFTQDDIIVSLTNAPANVHEALHEPYAKWTGPKDKVLEDVISALVVVKMLIGIPMNFMAIFSSFQNFHGTAKIFPVGSWANRAMRIALVLLAAGFGSVVPKFGDVFSLAASVCGPLLQVIFPLVMSWKIRKLYHWKGLSLLNHITNPLVIALGIFSMTIGFYESIVNVVADISSR